MGTEVIVEGLTKSFGRRTVWRDVTLTLPPGEVSVMLGPSGTGKTVFLKTLIGLIRPNRGKVLVDGVDTAHCSEHELYEVRKKFGVLFQDGALFGSLNLFDNIAFPLRTANVPPEAVEQRVRSIAQMLKVVDVLDRMPRTFSGGEQQRVAIGRAIVRPGDLLMLDEPLGSLDALTRIEMQRLIETLWQRSGATAILVTHDVDEAVALADRLILLSRGAVAEEWSVNLARPRNRAQPAFSASVQSVLDTLMDGDSARSTRKFQALSFRRQI